MAYMKGVEPAEAGWFTRLVYWFVRRNIGKVTGKSRLIEPVKVAAHHPRLLRAIGQMEGGIAAAPSVPAGLGRLASLQGARSASCRSLIPSLPPTAELMSIQNGSWRT